MYSVLITTTSVWLYNVWLYNVNNENGTGKYAVQKLCLFVYAIAISAYSNLKRLESNPSMIRLRLQAIKVITASSAHFVT